MRIAIVFFGVCRSFPVTIGSIRKTVYGGGPTEGIEVETIASLNLVPRLYNPRADEAGVSVNFSDVFLLDADYYCLAEQNDMLISDYLVSAQTQHDAFKNDWASVRNILHQLISLKRAWQYINLALQKRFEYFLFLRADLLYLDKFRISALLPRFQGTNNIFVPSWHSFGGFNDRFAFCDAASALHYVERISLVSEYCSTRPLHPEGLLAYALHKGGCKVGELPVRAQRVRAHGAIVPEVFRVSGLDIPRTPHPFCLAEGTSSILFKEAKTMHPVDLKSESETDHLSLPEHSVAPREAQDSIDLNEQEQSFAPLLPDVDAMLWASLRADQESAWHGHVSFAHWLVRTIQPQIVVELGTHNGVSFTAFCNAVARSNFVAKCYAVDTWKGDEHAGFYEEYVYTNLSAFNKKRFSDFSKLLRCRFDEALELFEDGSVDLLHVDGLHTYEAVRHYFDTWLSKMSERGVILFHDVMVRGRGFGVWQLWEELTKLYPSFSFEHSAGLGVLAVGRRVGRSVTDLCAVTAQEELTGLRQRFTLASRLSMQEGLREIKEMNERSLKSVVIKGSNIALNCPAFQSSAHKEHGSSPEGAVNGSKTGKFGFHTQFEENPWWMVDLKVVQPIDEIIIYNRLDGPCPARALNIIILLSVDGEAWMTIHSHNGDYFGGIDGEPLRIKTTGNKGRFVRLKLPGKQFLHLDEVEVYCFG